MICWGQSNPNLHVLSAAQNGGQVQQLRIATSTSRVNDRTYYFSPLAGTVVLLFAVTFGLTACSKKPVTVPDVSGQDPAQAQKTIAAAGLKRGNMSGGSAATPGAYVSSQSPAVGQQVPPNTAVDLVIDVPVTVPDLTGQNLTDAVSTLQGLDLKVAFVKKSSANPFGKTKVEQQDPAANASVHRNTMVTLTVSTPPDISAILGVAQQEPAYQKLKPQYKKILDTFLGNPSTPRSMDEDTNAPNTSSQPVK